MRSVERILYIATLVVLFAAMVWGANVLGKHQAQKILIDRESLCGRVS